MRGEDVKIKRPEQFTREHKIREGSRNKMQRRQREVQRKKTVTMAGDVLKQTVGLVVRIHEGRHASKEIKEFLRQLGLREKYDATLMKLDESTIGM